MRDRSDKEHAYDLNVDIGSRVARHDARSQGIPHDLDYWMNHRETDYSRRKHMARLGIILYMLVVMFIVGFVYEYCKHGGPFW